MQRHLILALSLATFSLATAQADTSVPNVIPGKTELGNIAQGTQLDPLAGLKAINVDKLVSEWGPGQPGNGERCSLLSPGVRDRIGRYCANGYGISMRGYILNDSCFYNVDDAINYMRSSSACYDSLRHGYCQIMQPNQRDQIGRYCDKAYGIDLGGYVVNNSCWHRAEDAIATMQNTRACDNGLRYRNCTLFQPRQRDRNGRYCEQGYGVGFQGSILNNACYSTIDSAGAAMENTQACYY